MTPKVLTVGLGDKTNTATLYYGIDVVAGLKLLQDQSVNCCVTSPPYFNLRSYTDSEMEIGKEDTPDEYIARLVAVFREVKRVLRDDGTLWLNLGDSYAANGTYQVPSTKGGPKHGNGQSNGGGGSRVPEGLKAKDLIGIPWMAAFALRADGWYLRQEIIWQKPNCMPESVKDRCTKSHEHIFLLSKNPDYYYDADSVMEDGNYNPTVRDKAAEGYTADYPTGERFSAGSRQYGVAGKRNRRSVWSIPTQPYQGSHFAVMPEALVEPCVKAGCLDGGLVLDPFSGSGTTGAVSTRLGRNYVGIDLNPEYLNLAEARLQGTHSHEPCDPPKMGDIMDIFG